MKTRPLVLNGFALLVGLAFAVNGCSAAEIPAAQPEAALVPEEVEEPAASETADEEGGLCDGEQLSAEQVYGLMTDATIEVTVIDIRRPGEYEEGHVPGALYIGIMQDDFLQRVRDLPRDGNYIIICWHGNTSRSVVYNMMREGFTSVCDVAGGYDGWRAAGLPLEEGPA